ncbi:hypothetical protein Rruber_05558 (plasmid) [Rhodococcus ruber]
MYPRRSRWEATISSEQIPVDRQMRELFHRVTGSFDYCASDVERQLDALAYLEAQALHVPPFEDFPGRAVRGMVAEAMRRLDLRFSNSASNGTPPSMPCIGRRCGSRISTSRWLCRAKYAGRSFGSLDDQDRGPLRRDVEPASRMPPRNSWANRMDTHVQVPSEYERCCAVDWGEHLDHQQHQRPYCVAKIRGGSVEPKARPAAMRDAHAWRACTARMLPPVRVDRSECGVCHGGVSVRCRPVRSSVQYQERPWGVQ